MRNVHGLDNGFRVAPEPEPISVDEENIAQFTLPAEVFSYTPPSDIVNCVFKNGDVERKIYCNIQLNEKEQNELRKLQEEARAAGVQLFPSIAVMATRFLSRARGDIPKALRLMRETQEWRRQYFSDGPVSDRDLREDLQHGIIYFCGRDKDLRPTIVVRPQRIPQQWYKEKRTDKLIRVLVFCMEYMIRYMVIPGKVENNCVIMDLKDVSLGLQSGAQLKEIYSVMSHHYIGRVFKFYICNLTPTLKRIGGWVTNILTDRQKQKLVFVENISDLANEFAMNQLERDLGGSRPVAQEFYPFPLPGGPFEVGAAAGSGSESVGGGHTLLTADGARGRLWDAAQCREANLEHEYTPEAYEFLKKFDLPIPPECVRAHLQRVRKSNSQEKVSPDVLPEGALGADPKEAEGEPSPEPGWSGDDSKANLILPAIFNGKDKKEHVFIVEDDIGQIDEPTIQNFEETSIRNGCVFSCKPCM